mmetsp:Transcript_48955/g.122339  ORF Transcript_48955/g.122339 Transcript_48955/m.122339 type:complete len:325 (+) Transcript_48955:199-1173(+)
MPPCASCPRANISPCSLLTGTPMNSPTAIMQLRGEVPVAPRPGSAAIPPNVFGVVPDDPNISFVMSTGLAPGVHSDSPAACGSSTPVVRTDSLGLRREKDEFLPPNCSSPAWRCPRRCPPWGDDGERSEWHSSRSQSRALVECDDSWSSSTTSSSSESLPCSSPRSSDRPCCLLPPDECADEGAPPRGVGVPLRSRRSSARMALVPALAGVVGEKTPRDEADLGVSVRRFLADLAPASSSWSPSLSLLAARAATSFLSWSTWPSATCLRSVEFQWFLMALSVRPGRSLAISVQRLPWISCALTMMVSSSSVQGPRLIEGSSWFL